MVCFSLVMCVCVCVCVFFHVQWIGKSGSRSRGPCSLLLSGEGKQEPGEKVTWDWIFLCSLQIGDEIFNVEERNPRMFFTAV